MTFVSVVVPALNEQSSLKILADEVRSVCQKAHLDYELIFVDDGSTDGTWQVIESLTKDDQQHIRGIRFSRNYGKASALAAGYREATAEIIVQMDADLQDDPAEIPRFVEKIQSGFDLVCGYKKNRHDPFTKVIGSRIYNKTVSVVGGVPLHDHNCGYKAFVAVKVKQLKMYGEMHRLIPSLMSMQGARICEIVVNHRPRKYGTSKYGAARIAKGLFDLLTVFFLVRFRSRPLHFLGGIGTLVFMIGLSGLGYLAVTWLSGNSIGHRPLMIYSSAAMILGFQLLATGILAELITWYLLNPRNNYYVRTTVSHPHRSVVGATSTGEAYESPAQLEHTRVPIN